MAWDFKKAWPSVELHFVPDAGHSAKEPGTTKLLSEVSGAFYSRLQSARRMIQGAVLILYQAADKFAEL
jgi:hypothetical protein